MANKKQTLKEYQGFLCHLEFLNPRYALSSLHYITFLPLSSHSAGMRISFVVSYSRACNTANWGDSEHVGVKKKKPDRNIPSFKSILLRRELGVGIENRFQLTNSIGIVRLQHCTEFRTVCMTGLLLCSKSLDCLGLARGQPYHSQGRTTWLGRGAQSSFQESNHPSAWSQCIQCPWLASPTAFMLLSTSAASQTLYTTSSLLPLALALLHLLAL